MQRTSLRHASMLSVLIGCVSPAIAAPAPLDTNDVNTRTPIKHVIIIVGENRTFDHLFGTYIPRNGQTISNLLSKGIVKQDGSPSRKLGLAAQKTARDTSEYSIAPTITGSYTTLTPPTTGKTHQHASDTTGSPFATIAAAATADKEVMSADLLKLTTGATGLPANSIDTRIPHVMTLPNGPFSLGDYENYTNDPVHRFYQMWQQEDCSAAHATAANPSGCRADLFPWVAETIYTGSNGRSQPPGYNNTTSGQGGLSMGFYNVAQGDMPYFKALADRYAISDNYHQPVMGGTGANSIMLGTADALYYEDARGNPAVPPANQIENPNPAAGTNNWYTQDGYSGGTYSACADANQPGVKSIVAYLASLKKPVRPNCEPGHYYLLNNYNPGYFGNGTVNTVDTFTIPPSTRPTIADTLMANHVSWKYYGEGWNAYVANPGNPNNVYCNICNPFQYETAIMTNAAVRTAHLKDTTDLTTDIAAGQLPAVSYVKPGELNDGHPKASKYSIYESFVRKILTELQSKPALWASTAVFITNDEGGGFYDSGYIQPLDFFGDGTRIPLIVVSPYSVGGKVSHEYADHVSILKFIEANWGLPTISSRSRDNLPNPVTSATNPYVPTNGPAIGDLMDMFNFAQN